MSSNGENIPCKSTNTQPSNKNKGGRGGGGKPNGLRGNDKEVHIKECDLCTQWNPCAKNTLWTSERTRFNKDGFQKEGARPYGGADGGGNGKPCYKICLVNI